MAKIDNIISGDSTLRDYINGQFKYDKKQEVGIGGFTAYATVKERFNMSCAVPTVFLEDGTHVNDHIIRQPITLTIEGSVANVHIKPSRFIDEIITLQSTIGAITKYIPDRTAVQLSKVNALITNVSDAIDKIDSAIAAGRQLSDYIGRVESAELGNMEKFIVNMLSIYNSNRLISIDMPYHTFPNMCITSIEIERDNENNAIFFRLEAQEFRYVQSTYVIVTLNNNPATVMNGQTFGVEYKGVQEGRKIEGSTFSNLIGIKK